MRSPERERLFISGTASIAQSGASTWPGNAARQIDHTMWVIEALLESRGMTFSDVDRASAYFKNGADLGLFVVWLREHAIEGLPYIPMQCDVCRDDLLFELEVDAKRAAVTAPA
jgi:enamine deaminase RidA (YjgF/YER057c/UK114 family)